MSFIPDTIAARIGGQTVTADQLVLFDWLPTASRYWPGFGELITADGNLWNGTTGNGTDSVLKIDGLEYALGTGAPKATFTVGALDPNILVLAQGQATLVKNRQVTVYLQFFDANQQPLDTPYPLWVGFLDVMSYRSTRDGAYQVSVTAEGPWTRRNRPAAAYYDPQDQAARGYPGDTGLNQIPALAGQTLLWKTT